MFRRTLMALAIVALCAPAVRAQSVDEIVAKNIQARGGMDKLKAVTTMKASGKMVMGQGMEAPFVRMQKRPKSMRTEFTFQGLTGVQAYDGKTAWNIMPFMGKKDPEAVPAEETKQVDEQADFDGMLVDWKDKGNKVEYLGKEQVEGADAYKLKVTLKSGEIRNVYVDAETGLDVKVDGKTTVRGTEIEFETLMSDFKEVSGMMMPFTMESGAKGAAQKQKIVVEKYELNTTMPDTLFTMPAVAAKPDSAAAAKSTTTAKTADAAKTTDAAKATTTSTTKTKKK